MLFFILILIIAAAAALARQIRIVPHQMTYVIERFGKYYDTWEDGLHVKMPIADRIVKKVSKKERVYDFPPQDVITKDNVTISIDSVVYASVFDPQSYTYSIDNPILGLQNLTATTLRSIIGSMELDQTLSSRSEINQHMRTVLDEATDGWGIRVSRVEVKNIKPPAEIEEVLIIFFSFSVKFYIYNMQNSCLLVRIFFQNIIILVTCFRLISAASSIRVCGLHHFSAFFL